MVKGMKQTDIGWIPEDWRVYTVLELIDLLTDYDANGSFSSVAENVKSYNYEEYAWYVRSTDLENNSKLSDVKYVDKDFLKNLTSETIVINVGRGDLINEMDLINYSNQSKNNVRFYLDVVNDEPLDKEDKLWKCKNIFITPHNSFSSDLHRERLQSLIFENITSIINKSKLRNEVKGE